MKPGRLVGLLFAFALAMVIVSCGVDQSATPSEQAADFSPTGIAGNLLKCTPSGYAFSGMTIGPSGGTIKVGKHKLEIPRGALSRNVFIRMEMRADTTNSVQLLPEGLTFNRGKPATLTLNYDNCGLVSSLLPRKIAYTTNSLQILRLLPSLDDKLKKKVSTNLDHFSRYAVAW